LVQSGLLPLILAAAAASIISHGKIVTGHLKMEVGPTSKMLFISTCSHHIIAACLHQLATLYKYSHQQNIQTTWKILFKFSLLFVHPAYYFVTV
jgi:hypothetical protein